MYLISESPSLIPQFIGVLLFIDYFLLTFICGMVLLLCMVGTICLSENKFRKHGGLRKQTKFIQDLRRPVISSTKTS